MIEENQSQFKTVGPFVSFALRALITYQIFTRSQISAIEESTID